MRDPNNKRAVEKAFRDALKSDRARSRVLRMSAFGLIELTRQRMRPSLRSSTYLKCPHCGGTGVVKSFESQSIEMIRLLNLAAARKEIKQIELTVSPEVASFLQNRKRALIARLENEAEKTITIHSDQNRVGESHEIVCYDERGSIVKF
jgi:ribonuclease E